jgi:hypothetical protein
MSLSLDQVDWYCDTHRTCAYCGAEAEEIADVVPFADVRLAGTQLDRLDDQAPACLPCARLIRASIEWTIARIPDGGSSEPASATMPPRASQFFARNLNRIASWWRRSP